MRTNKQIRYWINMSLLYKYRGKNILTLLQNFKKATSLPRGIFELDDVKWGSRSV